MSNNLTIENLTRSVETGDVERFMGGGAGGATSSESRVMREMQSNGMDAGGAGGLTPDASKTFSAVLHDSFAKVNQNQVDADRAIKELVSGRTKNVHETMLAVERADASLKLMMQVRNKVLDAYREIMRMQV